MSENTEVNNTPEDGVRWLVVKAIRADEGDSDSEMVDSARLGEFDTEEEAENFAELLQSAGETDLIIARVLVVHVDLDEPVYVMEAELDEDGMPMDIWPVFGPVPAEDAYEWADQDSNFQPILDRGHTLVYVTESNWERAKDVPPEDRGYVNLDPDIS